MPVINLYDILKAANGQFFGETNANLFTDFALTPQQATDNTLFVARRTEQGDTHQYIAEAIANGASGILCMEPPTCDTENVSVLMVRDTVDALLHWAHYTLGKRGVQAIAVAGSSGKSMALEAITHVLGTRYEIHRGNVDADGRLSVALALAKLTPEHDYVVLKLSSAYPGEMAQMVEAIQPRIAVINRIDCVHPAAFKDCKQYIDEQSVLVEYLSPGALAVFNYDDDETRNLASRARESVVVKTVGCDRFGADVLAFNVKVGRERIGFDVRYAGERYVGRWSPVLGQHHLYGLLSSLAVADYCEIPIDEALKTLTNLAPLAGRMSPLQGEDDLLIIDDSYRASHTSTLAALDWLDAIKMDADGRKIFIMGAMDPVGDNSRYAHRSVGQHAAEIADIIITQGAEAALVSRAAMDSGMAPKQVRINYSTRDTVEALRSFEPTANDVVLVKGGENARMETVVERLLADSADSEKLVRQSATPLVAEPRPLRPTWVEVDASILAQNVRTLKALVGDEVTLMAVVKADGYGHGAVMVARTALLNGAEYLCVASMAEAMELRAAGITAPTLVLSYAPTDAVRQAIRHDITLTIYDLDWARLYNRAAQDIAGKLRVHINIDTGIGRVGFFPDDVMTAFRHMQSMSHLDIEGIYTHFADADVDRAYTQQQAEIFRDVVRPLRAAGFQFKYIHAANSPATLLDDDFHFNLVRPGLAMYGLRPTEKPLPYGIQPLLTWKTTVIQVRTFPSGYPIGYGRTYYTSGRERIAMLPVGYSDGFRRSPQTWQYVLIHGQRAPVVGRVSMEKAAVNVSEIADVKSGDEVVLLGSQGEETITAEMIAEWLGTTNYEVLTTLLPRVPRL